MNINKFNFYFIKILILIHYIYNINAYAKENINICIDENNPPFMFKNSNNKADGLYYNIINDIFINSKELSNKYKLTIEAKPWKRCLYELEKEISGVGGISTTSERFKIYDFTDKIFVEEVFLFMKKQNEFQFNNIKDLYGKTLGVLRGWSYGDSFDMEVKNGKILVEEANSDKLNLLKLTNNRGLDAVLSIKEAGFYTIKSLNFKNISKSEKSVVKHTTHIAFNKKSNKQKLINEINKELLNINIEKYKIK